MAYLSIDAKVPLWGLEGVYRNGENVGHLRIGEFGYFLNKSIGKSYISCPNGAIIDKDYLCKGKYEIEVLGQKHDAELHVVLPFYGR